MNIPFCGISWQEKGLTITSDFQQVKKIMNVDSLDQLYLFLCECPPITTVLHLKWNNKILFRMALPDTPVNDDLSSITMARDEGFQDIDDTERVVTPDHRERLMSRVIATQWPLRTIPFCYKTYRTLQAPTNLPPSKVISLKMNEPPRLNRHLRRFWSLYIGHRRQGLSGLLYCQRRRR